MSSRLLGCSILVAAAIAGAHAQDLFDRVDEALTLSILQDRARLRLSGTLDVEFYHVAQPPFALIDTESRDLFNSRLSLFLDMQLGPKVYAFAQMRADRGFDAAEHGAEVRLDEYAVRVTPWEEGRFNIQIGKFSAVVGNWIPRHLSWDNPFVTAPLPYEHMTRVSDTDVPADTKEFSHPHGSDAAYGYNPLIWGPDYTSGMSVSGRIGVFEYAAELKNAALSSRPESWDATQIGFDHPTFSSRLGWHPSATWNFGISASRGPYLRPEAGSLLPRGRGIGDYEQLLLGQDIAFAWRHLQIWAEFFETRFEVPRVGNADTFACYVEAKYKFSPELFAAVRWNQQLFANVPDGLGGVVPWDHEVWRADAAVGYRFTAHTQLKVQYSLQKEDGLDGENHAVAVQFTVRF